MSKPGFDIIIKTFNDNCNKQIPEWNRVDDDAQSSWLLQQRCVAYAKCYRFVKRKYSTAKLLTATLSVPKSENTYTIMQTTKRRALSYIIASGEYYLSNIWTATR